ncbi:MAG: PQQ-dependent sugar dehydrogenase [Bauldia sp.]|nr:PQQ-dependent sugar dehydrogenase [Bauldia sp.]
MTGTVFIGASEYSVREGEPYVTVTFQRTGDTSGAVSIDYATTPDTATEGVDYQGVNATAVIAAGETSVTVRIPIYDDGLSESTETFGLSILTVDSGQLLYPRTANISILDDENPVTPAAQPPLTPSHDVTTTDIITGLDQPIHIEWIPGSDSTALVAEKGGVIKVVDTTAGTVESVLLDISDQVNNVGDRGLMDIAIHPDFANNPYLYAFYVVDPADTATASGLAAADGGGNRYAYVVRYEIDTSGSTMKIVDGSETILVGAAGQSLSDISGDGALDFTDPANSAYTASDIDPATGLYKQDYIKVDSLSHAGGSLAFGPDGALYIGIGDGTSYSYDDARSASVQDVDSLSGKILRIDPITGDGLADNPFADSDLTSNASKVWQLGLRNPYALAFADDGRLFISETGWYSHEEINTGDAGANFGWPYYEGDEGGTLIETPGYRTHVDAADFYSQVASGAITVTAAYESFSHADADPGYQVSAIVGASDIYTGSQYPVEFLNDYFFTDIVQGEIYSIDINDRTQVQFVTDIGAYGPVSFSQSPDGYIYIVDLVNGRIARLNIAEGPATTPPPTVSSGPSEKLYHNTSKDQILTGTTANDVFVVDAKSTGFEIGPTNNKAGFVLWKGDSTDILFGFEKIRFKDTTIDLTKMEGPVYQDSPTLIQHLEGATSNDTFVISRSSSDYAWSVTKDGKGVVIWTVSGSDNTYDVLEGFETIKFKDATIDVDSIGATIKGTRQNDRIDAKHSPKGQPHSTDGDDTIFGGGRNDKIKGLDGDDALYGGPGNDRIAGGAGNDLLSGSQGHNKLIGGGGADSFLFNSRLGQSFSTIKGFDSAEGDRVILDTSVFDDKALKDGDLSQADFVKLFNYSSQGILKYEGEKIAKFMGHPDLHSDDFFLI